MIPEESRLLLVEPSGKKYLIRTAKRMIEVGGLGVVDGEALCASNYGDKLRIGGREYLLVRPSLKDAIGLLERRAQVIIPKDSFVIPLHLDLGCGSRVIEAGVGSGALTLVLLKSVGPSGKVISYENRADFAELARRNIALSENPSAWELRVEDICTAKLELGVDAAMLDIPNPWDALENVFHALRIGGHAGCYVPNTNQLESAVKKMRGLGLSDIVSFETLQREMIVHEGGVRPSFDMLGHTGYLAFGRKMSK